MKMKFTVTAFSFITFDKHRPPVMNKGGIEGGESKTFVRNDTIITDDPEIVEYIRKTMVGKVTEEFLMGGDADQNPLTRTLGPKKENEESWLPSNESKEDEEVPTLDFDVVDDDEEEEEKSSGLGEPAPPVKKKKKKKKKKRPLPEEE